MTDLVSPSADLPTATAAPAAASGFWRESFDVVRTLAVGLAAAVAFQTVLFQPFTIPSSSMEPGLVTGDYIIVSKFPYGWSRASLPFDPPIFNGRIFAGAPMRGDVVVFRLPRDPQQTWIKRVIGLPGDRVQVRGGQVFVNGVGHPQTSLGPTTDHDHPDRQVTLVRETALDGRSYDIYDWIAGGQGDDTDVFVVPEGQYFVMGDNRDNSLDSRWSADTGIGLLPAENLIGRAELIAASWEPGASLWKPWTWFTLQPGRFFQRIR